jgi:hypothetical protein
MNELYLMFCMPSIVIEKDTGKLVSQEYKWVNQDAEKLYNRLQEIVTAEYVKEREHEAMIHNRQ